MSGRQPCPACRDSGVLICSEGDFHVVAGRAVQVVQYRYCHRNCAAVTAAEKHVGLEAVNSGAMSFEEFCGAVKKALDALSS